jgi:hypothetical protein
MLMTDEFIFAPFCLHGTPPTRVREGSMWSPHQKIAFHYRPILRPRCAKALTNMCFLAALAVAPAWVIAAARFPNSRR